VTGDLPPLAATLVLPVWARARYGELGPERADPHADALLARLGADTRAMEASLGTYGVLALGRRAAWIDAQVHAWGAAHPDGCVLNLGAGLDTPGRRLSTDMPLGRGDIPPQRPPPGVGPRHVHVDLPEVIALRRALLPEHPHDTLVAARLEDPASTDALPPGTPACVVLAGVSMYLPRSVLEDLLDRLRTRAGRGSVLLLDTYAPLAAWLTNRMIAWTGLTEAPVHAGARAAIAGRVRAGTLRLRAEADPLAAPLPDGLDAWTRTQVAFARAVGFSRLHACDLSPTGAEA
jgi:O-methyltransferase involved in polyketide biosynthesis